MTRSRYPSAQTTAVVLALAEEPTAWLYGYQLCRQLDIKPGSLYPILVRLADRGLLETSWDTDVPAGRPPRHRYRLTGSGQALATELTAITTTIITAATATAIRRSDLKEVAGRMSGTRRRVATVITLVVMVAWVVFYAVALTTADQPPGPVTAVAQLVVPPLLWVALLQIGSAAGRSARLLLRHWRSWVGSAASSADTPGRLLTAAVAALPERRRDWGSAMLGELAEVQGRSARWRFALSSARAALWLPPPGGRPVLALVTGAVVAPVAAVGPAVRAAVPGLTVFAVTFTGLVGTLVVLAVARSRRLRLPVPVPTVLVTGAVAASIAATVIFLRREPAAAEHLSPPAAVYLAVWLPGALRRHAIDGRTLDGELVAPVGVNLADALVFCLGIFPVFGLTLGVVGAALGVRRAAANDPVQGRPLPT